MAARRLDHWNYCPPNGENYIMVAERAQAALDDIVALAADRPVAVFAHGAIGRVLRGLFLAAPQADILKMDQPQDAFFRLHRGAAERIGALSRLGGLPRPRQSDQALRQPRRGRRPDARRSRRASSCRCSGPSGCGKTTTLQMIAGFVEPSGGAIRLEGRDLLAVKPAKRGLGIVFQSYALFPHMTVAENVAFGLEMQGVAGAERDAGASARRWSWSASPPSPTASRASSRAASSSAWRWPARW